MLQRSFVALTARFVELQKSSLQDIIILFSSQYIEQYSIKDHIYSRIMNTVQRIIDIYALQTHVDAHRFYNLRANIYTETLKWKSPTRELWTYPIERASLSLAFTLMLRENRWVMLLYELSLFRPSAVILSFYVYIYATYVYIVGVTEARF